MSSFSSNEPYRALQIIQALRQRPVLAIPDVSKGTAQLSIVDSPIDLLYSLRLTRPRSAGLVFLDLPRASRRRAATLPSIDEAGDFITAETAREDPGYQYRLRISCLVYAHLAASVAHPRGIVAAIATPDTYMAVRGAIEMVLGPDSFMGEVVYQTRTGGGNDSQTLSIDHETLLLFARMADQKARLVVAKTDEELARYSLEDGQGKFFWDTYIRRQARNFYPITCPDGTVLERDQNGERISWYYSERTFIKELRAGNIKFEKTGRGWRLFMKERLEEPVKILRSLIFNNTDLEQGRGRDFMTTAGTQEVSGFTGAKPDFTKSSAYFQWLLPVLARPGLPIVVPTDEYGAAVAGFLSSRLPGDGSSMLVRTSATYEQLVRWRVEKAGGDVMRLHVSIPRAWALEDFLEKGGVEEDAEPFTTASLSFLEGIYGLDGNWTEVRDGGIEVRAADGADVSVCYVVSAELQANQVVVPIDDLLSASGQDLNRPWVVYSPLARARLRPLLGERASAWPCHQVPGHFFQA